MLSWPWCKALIEKDKPKNDGLEQSKDRDAAPEADTSETAYSIILPKHEGSEGVHPDGDDFGEADTDRHELGDECTGIQAPRESPTSISFELKNIRSLNAKCFFCKADGCDQVFLSRSAIHGKTRGYAVHSDCVFDHERLEAIGSGGGT